MFKKRNKYDLIHNTDYSQFQLLDFSIETFRYFDENGINFTSGSPGIKIEYVENLFGNMSDFLSEMGIDEVQKENFILTNIQKENFDSLIEINSAFFIDFYKNSLEYKKLFEIFGSSGIFSYENNLGNGYFFKRIGEQVTDYVRDYLSIHLNKVVKSLTGICTLVNQNGSPTLYMGYWYNIRVCTPKMNDVFFSIFDKFNNDKIKTFNNIIEVRGISLVDNLTLFDLGSIEMIEEYCLLRNSLIFDLGNLTFIKKSLIIDNCINIKNLGKLKKIGENLNLRGSNILIIENLIIGGDLILNKKFKNDYVINNCKIKGEIKYFNKLSQNHTTR